MVYIHYAVGGLHQKFQLPDSVIMDCSNNDSTISWSFYKTFAFSYQTHSLLYSVLQPTELQGVFFWSSETYFSSRWPRYYFTFVNNYMLLEWSVNMNFYIYQQLLFFFWNYFSHKILFSYFFLLATVFFYLLVLELFFVF